MSTALIQGNFMGKAIKVDLGSNKKDQPELKIEFELVGGEHNGRKLPYSGLFTDKSVKYTRQAMRELGWNGEAIPVEGASAFLSALIMKAAKVVPVEVTIASWTNPDTKELREWSTVRNVGTYTAPVVPASKSQIADVNKWLADAAEDQNSIPF